ncbi:MAG: hypothetical protein K2N80_08745 [Lachnospiraceae bacterium]|nr:hypothetical protein [Lachnospiraceae bacterium]
MGKKRHLWKKILVYVVYYLYFLSVIVVMYKRGFSIISFFYLLWAVLVTLGLLESLLTRKKRRFFNQIDEMKVEDFYDEVVLRIIEKKGYVEKNRSIRKNAIIVNGEHYAKNPFCIVCFVKKDYVYDEDFIDFPIETNGNIFLCLNTYYRGSKFRVYIDRGNIWKYYRTVVMNKDMNDTVETL